MRRAAVAGADVRRGVTVTGVVPGTAPAAVFQQDGRTNTLAARLIVGADGRRSQVRLWAGFEVGHDPKWLAISGVLVSGMKMPHSAVQPFGPRCSGRRFSFFPLAKGSVARTS